MSYDLYNINEKIIIKSDQKVGFLTKNPRYNLEVSGSTWAKNITGNNFSGISGYFNYLYVLEPQKIEKLNVVNNFVNTVYFQDVDVFANNIYGNQFNVNNFSGINFTFNTASGQDANVQNIYAKNLKGEVIETDGIYFSNEKCKILTSNEFFPFNLYITGNDIGGLGPSFNFSGELNGSSTNGYFDIKKITGVRNATETEGLLQTPSNITYTLYLTFDYTGIYSSIPNINFGGERRPTVLLSPGNKNAAINLSSIKLQQGYEYFQISQEILMSGVELFDNFNKVKMESYNQIGKWYYMIIG
jgi:hypothetical protein